MKGFTLIELITVLSIVLIFTVMSLPLGHDLMASTRATTAMDTLSHALSYAQQEAVLQGVTLTYCGSTNKKNCDGNWSAYHLIFIDHNKNRQLDHDDELLRIYPPLAGQASLTLQAFRNNQYLELQPEGYNVQQNGTFIYCSADKDLRYARALVINKSGRLRKVEQQATC